MTLAAETSPAPSAAPLPYSTPWMNQSSNAADNAGQDLVAFFCLDGEVILQFISRSEVQALCLTRIVVLYVFLMCLYD